MSCPHNSQIGDNYGTSCADCGEQLSGMGNWGEHAGKGCMHDWWSEKGSDTESCSWCGAERRKEYGS